MRRKQKPGLRKERIIMLAASVFVYGTHDDRRICKSEKYQRK